MREFGNQLLIQINRIPRKQNNKSKDITNVEMNGVEEDEMQTPVFENKVNWNTIPVFVLLASIVGGGITMWNKNSSKNDEQDKWMTNHDQYTRDRAAESRTRDGIQMQFNSQITSDVSQLKNDVNRVNERVTEINKANEAQDARFERFLTVMEGFRTSINDIKTEQRITKEILLRQDGQTIPSGSTPKELRND